MFIDCHAHLSPAEWQTGGRPWTMFDINNLLAHQEDAGVNASIFSNPLFGIPGVLDVTTLDEVRRYNDFAAELTAKYRGRLYGLASAVPFGGDDYLKETERAINECGLKGVLVNSSVRGEYLDSPRSIPFYELVSELGVPVFVHPPAITFGNEKMREFRLAEMVGRPCDTTLSLARVILSGILDRFPRLKFVAAHMGGGLSMMAGRMDYIYELRKETAYGEWGPDTPSKPPSTYFDQIYVDTMGFHTAGALCAVATFGVDHVLFGSDFPPVEIPLKNSVKVVDDLPISQPDKEKIAGANATRLFGLDSSREELGVYSRKRRL